MCSRSVGVTHTIVQQNSKRRDAHEEYAGELYDSLQIDYSAFDDRKRCAVNSMEKNRTNNEL